MSLGVGGTTGAETNCDLLDEQLGIDGCEGERRNDENGERSAMLLARYIHEIVSP